MQTARSQRVYHHEVVSSDGVSKLSTLCLWWLNSPPTHISQWLRILDIKMTCNYDVPKEHDLNKWTTHEVDHPPTRSTKFVCYRIQWINRESCISQHRCLGVCSMNWYISITVWEDGLPLASMDDQRQGHSLTAAALRWRGKREKATDKLHWFRYNW